MRLASWLCFSTTVFAVAGIAFGGVIDSDYVDPSLFNVNTFASGLSLPTDITPLSGGALLVSTSPGYSSLPGQMLYFGANGTPGPTVYTSSFNGAPINAMLTGTASLGSNLVVGNFQLGAGQSTLNILQPGATQSSPMSVLASLQLTYPNLGWWHDTVGMATRPTPGVPGSYDLILNVGSEADNVPTPSGDTVTLSGSGFGSSVSASMHGDSLYMVRINMNGAQPTVTAVQQVATGIRNVYGMAFDSAGNLYFTDNGIDDLPPGSPQPTPVNGAPPQADELNMIAANQLGVGAPPDFGYPNCYTQYAYGGVPAAQVGSGCVTPVVAFQPLTDSHGAQHEMIGPTDIAFAPANFPAPYNDGIFIGFTGGVRPGEESGIAFYSFVTNSFVYFVDSSNAPITNIIGLSSTNDALYFSDFGNGNVYEITAATSSVPEPASGLMVGSVLLAGAAIFRKRFSAAGL